MKDAVPRTHRLRANNALQSLWAGPNCLLVRFARATLVSLLSVATRLIGILYLFFRCMYVKQTRIVPSSYE